MRRLTFEEALLPGRSDSLFLGASLTFSQISLSGFDPRECRSDMLGFPVWDCVSRFFFGGGWVKHFARYMWAASGDCIMRDHCDKCNPVCVCVCMLVCLCSMRAAVKDMDRRACSFYERTWRSSTGTRCQSREERRASSLQGLMKDDICPIPSF